MIEVLIFATILAPVIVALVELIKKSAGNQLNTNTIPLIAFAVGIFIGFAAWPFTDLELILRIWAGGFAGLAATGLFELGSHAKENAKGDSPNG